MSSFWYTGATLEALHGEGFQSFTLFGPIHLFWLGLCAVLAVTLGIWYHRAGDFARRRALIVLTVLLLADEAFKQIGTAVTGQWTVDYLPLHVCSINIFVCLLNTLRPSDRLKEILYAVCLPGAAIALLSPTWLAEPMWNFMHLHSETVHILLLLYPVLLLAGGFRPSPKRLKFVFAFLGCTGVPIYFVNKKLDTNFFFLNGTENNPITEFFAGIFGERLYFLGYPFLVAALAAALYLPWYFVRKKEAKG